jgi:hypothetical protein
LRLLLSPLTPSLALWMAMSDDASLSLLGVASLLPWVGQSLTASLLVVTLRSSSVVFLETSLCSPWHGFHPWHSGHAPISPR